MHAVHCSSSAFLWSILLSSLAILDPRVGHTMDVLSPFISILCHSEWFFHRESCPRLDVVYPGRAWSSSPACNWRCYLHYFSLQAIPLFPHGVADYNQAYSDYKHSLTFHVRRYVVIATKPMHRLHNYRAPPTIPPTYIWVCAVVWDWGKGQTDKQTAMNNIHFALATPHANVMTHSEVLTCDLWYVII